MTTYPYEPSPSLPTTLTARDLYAAVALIGHIITTPPETLLRRLDEVAGECFEVADAMLAASVEA
ncbi:hypothetical protein [Burkholderia gladioli]|uniref:hypothetical protein n=1 Tax=Burkholderia gladioli TaxID=28095 RepID=UPI000627128D|nr:hypothetical protein [Burkholderia gladioli]KKJ05650.1 hypothetical protein XF14_16360 [Burkholderia gladioli]